MEQNSIMSNTINPQDALLDNIKTHEQHTEQLEYLASLPEKSVCFSCHLMGKYTDLAAGYVGDISMILSPIMLDLFNSTVPFWIVVTLIFVQIKHWTWTRFFQHLGFVFVTYQVFMLNQDDFISYIYHTALEIMGQTATLALLGGVDLQIYTTQSYAASGMVNLVYTVEEAIEPITELAWIMMEDTAGVFFPGLGFLLGLFLIVPYFFVLTVYFSKVAVAVFRVMMLAMFAPVIIYFSAFSFGKDMWKSALKTLLASIMILLACTAAIAMLMYGAQNIVTELKPTGKDFFTEHKLDVLLLILLGLMGTAFMAEANGIANSLAGTVLSNAATAIMTGGVAAGGAAVGNFAKSRAASAASSALPAGSAARSTATNVAAMTAGGPVGAAFVAAKTVADKIKSLKEQAG